MTSQGRAGRLSGLAMAALATLAVAGCHPKEGGGHFGIDVQDHDDSFRFARGPASAPTTLDCPAQVEDLSRTAQAGDGRSCAYAGRDGMSVQLSLMPLDGQAPQARLASLEQALKGQLGPIGGSPVHVDADGDRDRANIDLPGFHLHANGDGKAVIRMPGVSIDANGDRAQVDAGWGSHKAVVDADGNGAEVRAGAVNASGANLTYVLTSSRPGPTGLRAAGYVAGGPAGGPLVVGVFRTPEAGHGHELDDSGLRRLIRMNTGQG